LNIGLLDDFSRSFVVVCLWLMVNNNNLHFEIVCYYVQTPVGLAHCLSLTLSPPRTTPLADAGTLENVAEQLDLQNSAGSVRRFGIITEHSFMLMFD